MLVTRETDYAIRCVLELARHDRMTVADVARARSISPTFLSKIVQKLGRDGIVRTRRGAGGGVSLGRPPAELTLLQVIEAIEGPITMNVCGSRSPASTLRASCCPVHSYLGEAVMAVRAILSVRIDVVLRRAEREATSGDSVDAILNRAFARHGHDHSFATTPNG